MQHGTEEHTVDTLRKQHAEAKARAYSLKTKAAQAKAWTVVRDIEHQILTVLYAQRDSFRTHSVKATVRWFHEGDDTVSLTTPYGNLWGSPTSDAVSKSWYGHTCCVIYKEGQEVIVEIDVDVDSERLCLQVIPKRILGGTLDEAKYAELDKRTDLAFFKHSGSNGVTGLFAQAKTETKGA